MYLFDLTLSTLDKIFSGGHSEIFSYFSQKTGFDISCKLSQLEMICMKCQIRFFWENFSSAQFAQRVVKLKHFVQRFTIMLAICSFEIVIVCYI